VQSSVAVTDQDRTERRLLRTAEAARELGIDASTLRRWARAGTVSPAERTLGGQDRWDLADLRRQVRERLDQRDD
jgi:DNA-binding transcriptional MerR regulator